MQEQDLRSLKAAYLPGSGRQVIDNQDFYKLALAAEAANRLRPVLLFNDANSVKVLATADSPAAVFMQGFPNILHPGHFLTAGLTDGSLRAVTSQLTLTFPTSLKGAEKASQWYWAYAYSTTSTVFNLRARPYFRVKSQAGQVISLGTNIAPATDIGYSYTTDELANHKIYVLTGVSAGLLRTISANNNSGSAGTITYSGTALSLAEGDWFVTLPNNVNFRWLGDLYNNASSALTEVGDFIFGQANYPFMTPGTYPFFCPLTWNRPALIDGGAGGAGAADPGGGGGGAGQALKDYLQALTPGAYYLITVGAAGAGHSTSPTPGGVSSIGALLTLPGGAIPAGNTGGLPGGAGGTDGEDGDGALPDGGRGGRGGDGIWGGGGNRGKNAGGYGAGGGNPLGDGSPGFISIRRPAI